MPYIPARLRPLAQSSGAMRSVSIRLPEPLLAELETLANRIGADRAALIRTLLADAMTELLAEMAAAEAAETPSRNGTTARAVRIH